MGFSATAATASRIDAAILAGMRACQLQRSKVDGCATRHPRLIWLVGT
jgi:hypothetical protein